MVVFDLSKGPYDRVNEWLNLIRARIEQGDYQHHDVLIPSCLTLLSASAAAPSAPGIAPPEPLARATFKLKVLKQHTNQTGALHGGAVALIFDLATSLAISAAAKEGFWDGGHVSRTINCAYLRPLMEDEEGVLEAEVVSLSGRLAHLRGVIKNRDGQICYTCEHGKARVNRSPKI